MRQLFLNALSAYYKHVDPNLLGKQTGFFFTFINLYFVCGGDFNSAEGKEILNIVSLAFAALTATTTLVIPALKITDTDLESTGSEFSVPSENATPTLSPRNNINTSETELLCQHEYKKLIAEKLQKMISHVSTMGTVNAALNIMRFNPEFVSTVQQSAPIKIMYATFIFLMSGSTLTCSIIQNRLSNDEQHAHRFLTAFAESAEKSGAWAGAIFGLLLMQFLIQGQNTISSIEVTILAAVMCTLFFLDMLTTFMSFRENRRNTIPASREDASMISIINHILSVLRNCVGTFGNVLAIPNILSFSDQYNTATGSGTGLSIKQVVYGVASIFSLADGLRKSGMQLQNNGYTSLKSPTIS